MNAALRRVLLIWSLQSMNNNNLCPICWALRDPRTNKCLICGKNWKIVSFWVENEEGESRFVSPRRMMAYEENL